MSTVLFVHAHPDDESIMTGGAMAATAAAGASVVLLTATRGEGGDVLGEKFAHLEGDRAGLSAHRESELAAATQALSVSRAFFLGDPDTVEGTELPPRRFEDSGMVWGEDGHAHAPELMAPQALCSAPVAEVAAYIRAVLIRVRPDLVVTYGPGGGYGHPDHVRCHDATVAAVADLGEQAPLLVFAEVPAEVIEDAFDANAPGFDLTGFNPAKAIPSVPNEYPVAIKQDVSEFLGAKAMAMAAHHTQIIVAGEFFSLSNDIGQKILDTEYFTVPDYDGPVADTLLDFVARHRPAPQPVEQPATHTDSGGTISAHTDSGGATSAAVPVTQPGRNRTLGWVANLLHTLLVAVLVCVLGTLQHLNATAFNLAGQTVIVPWGLLLALALLVVSAWHIARSHRSTLLVVVFGVAVSVGSFLLGQREILPGSDLLVTGFYRSVIWLFAPMVVVAIMAFVLPSLKPSRKATSRAERERVVGE